MNMNTTQGSTTITPRLHNLLNGTSSSAYSLPNNSFSSININSNSVSNTTSPSPIMSTHHDSLLHTADVSMKIESKPTATFSTATKPKKARRKSSFAEDKTLLSTSSPEGIAAANEITPNRIAQILLCEGPLPIRHLTSHLTNQVPAFGNLSLSKQRRLIMSALESGDIKTGCVFEKIGWGQWEAKVVGQHEVKQKIQNSLNSSANEETNLKIENAYTHINPSKHQVQRSISSTVRRESITNNNNDDHNLKMPTSPTLAPIHSFRNSLKNYSINQAIESSSDDVSSGDDDIEDFDSFNLQNTNTDSPPPDYNPDVHNNKFSSTQKASKSTIRSTSIPSSSRRPSFAGVSKPVRKPRSSFTQYSLEVTLDDAPMERRESRVSFSNANNLSRQSFLRSTISPRLSNNNSSISIPLNDKEYEHAIEDDDDDDEHMTKNDNEQAVITDEEDWKAIGPSNLRKQSSSYGPLTPSNQLNENSKKKTAEEMAAIALMDLKTV